MNPRPPHLAEHTTVSAPLPESVLYEIHRGRHETTIEYLEGLHSLERAID